MMDNMVGMQHKKAVQITCIVGLIGSIVIFAESMIFGFTDIITSLMLYSAAVYAAILICTAKLKNYLLLAGIIMLNHVIMLVVMWYEYSLINYFVSIYAVYTIITLVILSNKKYKLKALLAKLGLLLMMFLYDVLSYDDHAYYEIDNSTYFDFVIGTVIIGLVFVMIVVQYTKRLETLNDKLYGLSVKDPLTGAYNFRLLEETLHRCDTQWVANGTKYTIALIDLDDFKQINDTMGHHKGDELLVSLVQQIKNVVRNTDKVFRYGGDEFIIVFPEMSEEVAEGIVTRIIKSAKSTLKMSFSAGICDCAARDKNNTGMIELADKRLYQAKQNDKEQAAL